MPRTVEFGGLKWTVFPVDRNDFSLLPRDKVGLINHTDGIICWRKTGEEYDKITILHELLHFCFPRVRESEVDRADWVLKEALEAFGVDLSPLTNEKQGTKRKRKRRRA